MKKKICPNCKKNKRSIVKGKVLPYCSQCNSKLTIERQRKVRWKYEKTEQQRKIRYIKRQTRRKYPLNDQKCVHCPKPATEHHHFTNPIEIDAFEYVCHNCHIQLNKKLKGG